MMPTDAEHPGEKLAYRYSRAIPIAPTEGRRIGLVTCLRCGAAVVVGEHGDPALHDQWHASEEAAT